MFINESFGDRAMDVYVYRSDNDGVWDDNLKYSDQIVFFLHYFAKVCYNVYFTQHVIMSNNIFLDSDFPNTLQVKFA